MPKLSDAKSILASIGMPEAQQSDIDHLIHMDGSTLLRPYN